MARTKSWSDSYLREAVKMSTSLYGVAGIIYGRRPNNEAYKTLRLHIQRLQLPTGHFLVNSGVT